MRSKPSGGSDETFQARSQSPAAESHGNSIDRAVRLMNPQPQQTFDRSKFIATGW